MYANICKVITVFILAISLFYRLNKICFYPSMNLYIYILPACKLTDLEWVLLLLVLYISNTMIISFANRWVKTKDKKVSIVFIPSLYLLSLAKNGKSASNMQYKK